MRVSMAGGRARGQMGRTPRGIHTRPCRRKPSSNLSRIWIAADEKTDVSPFTSSRWNKPDQMGRRSSGRCTSLSHSSPAMADAAPSRPSNQDRHEEIHDDMARSAARRTAAQHERCPPLQALLFIPPVSPSNFPPPTPNQPPPIPTAIRDYDTGPRRNRRAEPGGRSVAVRGRRANGSWAGWAVVTDGRRELEAGEGAGRAVPRGRALLRPRELRQHLLLQQRPAGTPKPGSSLNFLLPCACARD